MTGPAFTIPLKTMRQLASRAARIVEARTTIPILANVKIAAAEDGTVTLTATDLDGWIVAVGKAATIQRVGETCLPARLLSDCLKKLSADDVTIDAGETRAKVSAGRAAFDFHTLLPADFPDASAYDFTARFDLPPATLSNIASRVGFAISTEETRYYLNGVFLEPSPEGRDGEGSSLNVVATDGHRLSAWRLPSGIEGVGSMPGVIVPSKAVRVGMKEIVEAAGEATVAVAVCDRAIQFQAPGLTYTSKLIDGTFPDYRRVMPQSGKTRFGIDREALVKAIDRVTTIASERGRALKFAFEDGELRLSMISPDAGDAAETLAVEGDGTMETGFNGRYVLDALASIDNPRVTLDIENPAAPARLTDDADEARTIVLMPMRVS